jgi:hypothetical protein
VPLSCRFTAGEVDVVVAGYGAGTGRIIVAVTFQPGEEGEAETLIKELMAVLGSTMSAYDPRMPASRRFDMINALGEAAFEDVEAHFDSVDVHYGLTFEDASGRLEVVVAPVRLAHG